jgi:hypothetical protein
MKAYKMECIDCGLTFVAKNPKALRCACCRREAARLQTKEHQEKKRIYRDSIKPKKSISDVLRELKRYNEEHGTFLSYGEFIVMTEKEV